MEWTQRDQAAAKAFLDAVRDKKEAALFELSLCEVHTLPLPFYEGYDLVRIVNKHMLPYLVMDYLSNGEDHYYMDGAEGTFHHLNARQTLSLDESNVADYLDFYISYVYERGNSLVSARKESGDSKAALVKVGEDGFDLEVPLIYQNRRRRARITIDRGGAIHVRDPLQVSFLTDLKPGGETIRYRHPQEAKIIEEAESLLTQTETGQRLLQVGANFRADIRVLNSPNYHGFVTGEGKVYIIMPAAEQTGKHIQALVLAGCLRDLEQIRSGITRPGIDAEQGKYADKNYEKNLDILVQMCKIVEEMENKNMHEARLSLEDMGLEKLFTAFKNKLSYHGLMDAYIQALKDHSFIKDS